MANPDLIPVPFAQDGDKNPIPLERIISDPSYRATWLEGFPPDTRIPEEVGGEAPDGLDFNGLFNALSQAVVFLQKGNAYQFDAIMAPYPVGALVRSNDNLTTYQSTVPNNSNNPNSNMTGWRVYNGKDFLVNDLTTGGMDKALTAEAGKLFFAMFTGGANYFKIPNHTEPLKPWIFQMGTVTIPSAGEIGVTFPVAFPNACLYSNAGDDQSTTGNIEVLGTYNTTKTNMGVALTSQGVDGGTWTPVAGTVKWLAIGN